MPRFLPALIVLAGLFLLPAPARAAGRHPSADRAAAAQKGRRDLGELLVVGLLAGGIGILVVVQGVREFLACLPRGRQPVSLDDDFD